MNTDAPEDRSAELGVIGCCLLGGADTLNEALEHLSAQSFYSADCRTAYELMEGLLPAGEKVNIVTLMKAWQRTGSPFPEAIIQADDVPSHAMLEHYMGRVLEMAARRRVFWAAHDLLSKVGDQSQPVEGIIADAESEIFDKAPNMPRAVGPKEAVNQMIGDIEERWRRQGTPSGILTGLSDLDAILDGLQAGEQTIIAARPSQGKTALGLGILNRAMQDQIPSLFISLEMGVKPLMRRLASMHCQIPMNDLRKGALTQRQMEQLTVFASEKSKGFFHILDCVSGATDTQIASSIRRHVRSNGVKLVVIDYLQKITPSKRHEKRTYEVGYVSGTLKSVADRCGVAMLTLAQLNRESEKGQVPRLSDLADSGQIERDADVVGLLHRDRSENAGVTKLIIAKNRDGEIGIIDLHFVGHYCQFRNAERSC